MEPCIDVAVIGGGLSGALMAVLLQRRLPPSARIRLYEGKRAPGRGLAYSTPEPAHLLNAPAVAMGLDPEAPSGFADWVAARPGLGDVPGQEATPLPRRFLPRRLYGDYVEECVDDAARADRPGARLEVVAAPVTGLAREGGSWRLSAGGDGALARIVVLALGFPPAVPPAFTGLGPASLEDIGAEEAVLLIGSGLTMVDAVLGLEAAGHRGPIRAFSRHGALPLPHAPPPAHPWALAPPPGEPGVAPLLRWLRAEARRAGAEGVPWQAVMDSVRPRVPALWEGLDTTERRRFLRHALSVWNRHRHRLPPDAARAMEAFRKEGRLSLEVGTFLRAEAVPGGVAVHLRGPGGRPMRAEAARVALCTGPAPGQDWSRSPLVASLLREGLVRIDPLGLGLDSEAGTAALTGADGTPTPGLFALGPCAPAARWEITAVPEIRAQADALARDLAAHLAAPAVPAVV